MTLMTKVRLTTPGKITPSQAFDFAASLLGAPEDYQSNTVIGYLPATKIIQALPNQGLPALLTVTYGVDGPLPTSWEYGELTGPLGVLDIAFDTELAYLADNGARCDDLHAWLVEQTGDWINAQKCSWAWRSEANDEWNANSPIGNAQRGALR